MNQSESNNQKTAPKPSSVHRLLPSVDGMPDEIQELWTHFARNHAEGRHSRLNSLTMFADFLSGKPMEEAAAADPYLFEARLSDIGRILDQATQYERYRPLRLWVVERIKKSWVAIRDSHGQSPLPPLERQAVLNDPVAAACRGFLYATYARYISQRLKYAQSYGEEFAIRFENDLWSNFETVIWKVRADGDFNTYLTTSLEGRKVRDYGAHRMQFLESEHRDVYDHEIEDRGLERPDAYVSAQFEDPLHARFFNSLSGKLRKTLALKAGLDGTSPRELEEVGDELDITKEGVRVRMKKIREHAPASIHRQAAREGYVYTHGRPRERDLRRRDDEPGR